MTQAIARAPTISEIKVTPFDASQSGQGLRVEWLDEAGARCTATRFGLTAHRLIHDLHAASLVHELGRHCFLVGWIRGLADAGGLDD